MSSMITENGNGSLTAAVQDVDYENVLLMVMSTLNIREGRVSQSRYTDEETKSSMFSGYGQLEGLTKHVMKELCKVGQKLDRIVIVASDKTFNNVSFNEEAYKESSLDLENLKPVLGKDISAVNFFIERIKKFLSDQADIIREASKSDSRIPEWETLLPESGFYSSVEIENLFRVVRCETDEKGQNVSEIYFEELINQIKGELNKPIHVIMNMSGGLRNVTSNVDAVMQLLELQGVKIDKRYSTNYDNDNSINVINEVSQQYNSYKLISAMASFYEFADGKELEQYFQDQKDENTKELIRIINDISENIRLCDMNGFDLSIDDLKKFKEDNNKQLEKQIKIVYDSIIEDYSAMLENTKDVVPQIEWCVNKGMVQQALTIIESLMPEQIFSSKVFSVCLDAHPMLKKKGEEADAEMTVEEAVISNLRSGSESWKAPVNVLFDRWLFQYFQIKDSDICKDYASSSISELCDELVRNTADRKLKLTRKSQYNWNNITEYTIKFKSKKCKGKNESVEVIDETKNSNIRIEFQSKLNEKTELRFLLMMRLHRELKNQRNLANHASSQKDKLPMKQIAAMIRVYIQLAKNLGISK